jgi:hypothetical protein
LNPSGELDVSGSVRHVVLSLLSLEAKNRGENVKRPGKGLESRDS